MRVKASYTLGPLLEAVHCFGGIGDDARALIISKMRMVDVAAGVCVCVGGGSCIPICLLV